MMANPRPGTVSAAINAPPEAAVIDGTLDGRAAAAATAFETLKSVAADLKALTAREGARWWDDYAVADAPARSGRVDEVV